MTWWDIGLIFVVLVVGCFIAAFVDIWREQRKRHKEQRKRDKKTKKGGGGFEPPTP